MEYRLLKLASDDIIVVNVVLNMPSPFLLEEVEVEVEGDVFVENKDKERL